MKWLVDECVDIVLVDHLRDHGHDVVYVPDVAPQASDTELTRLAMLEQRMLLTEDKDFGDLVFRRLLPVPGLVLLRIGPTQRHRKTERLSLAIAQFGDALLGRYTVIEESRMRSRALIRSV